jgi:hypothetical protein
MRRLATWIGGGVWGFVAFRLWRRHRQQPAVATGPAADDADARAEELRAKLAEARAGEEWASDEPAPAEPGESAESVEERRRRVHEEGRAAIDRMADGDTT